MIAACLRKWAIAGLSLAIVACSSDDGAGQATDAIAFAGGDADALDAAGGSDDAAPADTAAAAADAGPVTPRGWVYLHDPITDQGQPTEVTLTPPLSTDGTLRGPYADVRNCRNEPGGPPIALQGVTVGSFCVEAHSAVAGADGTWLQILPPADAGDPQDPFAEVQMYHHVHEAHAFFAKGFGLDAMNFPLDALVNVNLWYDPKIVAAAGLPGGWQGFPNAAFVPKKGFAAFHLPDRAADAIIFGQYGNTDLSYDASVIYHEYTHAMVDTTRLSAVLPDAYGIDHFPGAMNEAFADYFAAAMLSHPIIGAYGIAFAGPHLVRDLSVVRKCPDDLTGEIHADGRILASALWKVRLQSGAFADAVILRALQAFTPTTSLQGAAKLIIAEAAKEDEALHSQFSKAFAAHGITTCQRLKPWKPWEAAKSPDKVSIQLMGKAKLGGAAAFPQGVPGHLQYRVDLPAGTKAVTLRWQAAAPGFFSQPTLAIAVQGGTQPLVNLFGGGSIEARAVLSMAPDPGDVAWQSLTLAGKCLAGADGKLFVMMLNQAAVDAEVTHLDVQFHSIQPAGPNLRGCD